MTEARFLQLLRENIGIERIAYFGMLYNLINKEELYKQIPKVNPEDTFRHLTSTLKRKKRIELVNTTHKKDRLTWVRFLWLNVKNVYKFYQKIIFTKTIKYVKIATKTNRSIIIMITAKK